MQAHASQNLPQTKYLKDYAPYPYNLESVDLTFKIFEGYTIVESQLRLSKINEQSLVLDGEHLELLSIKLNGTAIDNYTIADGTLTLDSLPDDVFTLDIETKIIPEENTRLEGLYSSGGNYCTQCESQGFRSITYFPDRPDVLSIYTTRIEANKTHPILLGNGNLIDSGELDAQRHFAVWEDPHKKPCYLFALVAGDLKHIHDQFTTRSGRIVDLYIYVRKGDEDQCYYAMDALKNSMKWDEDVYGLEYDLDIYNIVAVSDFNMGAMENKSLNIFNTALVLAHPATATDSDYHSVEGVIAHEYFHNWTGNRVTCRDWFQLSLKEGLTVFRDQEFSADMNSRAVQRIDDVSSLRRGQFAEDAGALAHPIRPEEYIEINNFYTHTVYHKGAEVIRMFHTLLGKDLYRKATDLYFKRHDGQAVTCEDWIQCMADASGKDLEQFKLWYSQAGTPHIDVKTRYDEETREFSLTVSQHVPETPGQPHKKPMHIPINIGLLDMNGQDLFETKALELTQASQEFTFSNIDARPVPSILRNFSAPVTLTTDLTDEDYKFLSQHDTDGFNKWDAGQILASRILHRHIDKAEKGSAIEIDPSFIDSFADLINAGMNGDSDKALIARSLTLPSMSNLVQQRELADPALIHKVRQKTLAAIKRAHKAKLEKLYKALETDAPFSPDAQSAGNRALRNIVLALLTATNGTGCAKKAHAHYYAADNMTDKYAALTSITSNKNAEREDVLSHFYEQFEQHDLVIDKWFAAQASSNHPDLLDHLYALKSHPDFNIKNPNRVRSLYSALAINNIAQFHRADGLGYKFLIEGIKELNSINPQIGARLLTPLRNWKNFSLDRQELIKKALTEVLAIENISADIYEIAHKSLNA